MFGRIWGQAGRLLREFVINAVVSVAAGSGFAGFLLTVLEEIPVGYAFAAGAVSFAGAATGMERISAWRDRLRDEDALYIETPEAELALGDDERPALFVRFAIHNNAPGRIRYYIRDVELKLRRPSDGGGGREVDDINESRARIILGHVRQVLTPRGLSFGDLMEADRVAGSALLRLEYGRGGLTHTVERKARISGYRVDGAWEFHVTNNESGVA